MSPARRNGLAILIVLLLGAGVASAFLVDEDDDTGETATGAAQTSTTVTTAPPTSAPPTSSPPTSAPPTTVADPGSTESTTTTAGGGATTTTALTQQPRTGGPAGLVPGLALAAAGLVLLRVVNPRRRAHPD